MTNVCTFLEEVCPYDMSKKCFTCKYNKTKTNILRQKTERLNPEEALLIFKNIDATGLSIGDCVEIYNEYIS